MYTFHLKQKSSSGFTLIELMIGVGIIAVLASIAMPSFRKYLFDAKEAEGIVFLNQLHKDQQRMIATNGQMSEFLTSSTVPNLGFSAPKNIKFNLITGLSPAGGNEASMGVYQLSDLPGFENLPNTGSAFGVISEGNKPIWTKYLIGAESNLDSDDFIHTLAVDENGNFFRLCDDYSDTLDPQGNTRYMSSYGVGVNCQGGGGGTGFPSGITGGGDNGSL